MLGKDDGNFFKVLTAIYAKAEDSIKKGFILYFSVVVTTSPDKSCFMSDISVLFSTPPPEKIHLSIFKSILNFKFNT